MWWLLACAGPPADRADAWLASLAAHRDDDAYAALAVPFPPEGGFDRVRFTKRVDRLELRALGPVRWEEPRGDALAGDAADGRRVTLRVAGRRVRDVAVDEVGLVPHASYSVVPAPPPAPAPWPPLTAGPGRAGLAVSGELPGTAPPGTALQVDATCRAGGRWVRNAMVGAVDGPFTLTVDVPAEPPCRLALGWGDAEGRRVAEGCWTGDAVVAGPCAEGPAPGRPPVAARDLAISWSPGGATVTYTLAVGAPLPPPHDPAPAVILTTLTCPGGRRPVRHARPIDATWVAPGEDRPLGSVLRVEAEGRPCALGLAFVRDDGYDRVVTALADACAAADGGLSPAPCR